MIVNAVLDFEANVASIIHGEGDIARTERIGTSLIADYTADGALVWIEVLSIAALAREDVQQQIRDLIGDGDHDAGTRR